MKKNYYIIPIFVPHQGCPHDCVFCNQKRITGQTEGLTAQEVDERIAQFLSTIPSVEEQNIEIAFYGGSFTGIEPEKQEELLFIAAKWKRKGDIKAIRISTRPDYINEEIMLRLVRYEVSIIELGIQSMDEDVLKLSCRGHSSEDVVEAVKLIRTFDIVLGLQMMVGLPGDTKSKILLTADCIINLKPDFVRIYPTLVIKDTELERMYRSGLYKPLELEEAVDICKDLLLKFKNFHIPIIRMGLQPSETVAMGKEVIAGPFHPAFRQMVESAAFKDVLDQVFTKNHVYRRNTVIIEVNPQYVSSLVGQKKSNIDYIRNKYSISRIKILKNADLGFGTIRILQE